MTCFIIMYCSELLLFFSLSAHPLVAAAAAVDGDADGVYVADQ